MKKQFFLALILSLFTMLACAPKVDTQLEQQVQKETSEFKKNIDEISKSETSLKYTADISFRELIPRDWIYEINATTAKQVQVYFGIPIPKDTIPGMVTTKTAQDMVYYTRGGKLNPETDKYVVQVYSGTTKLAFDKGGPPDWLQFPKLLSVDYLKGSKIVQSPYYIPPEATHGVFNLSGEEFRHGRSDYNMAQMIADLMAANPYEWAEKYEPQKLLDVIKRFKEQLAAIKKDTDNATGFIQATESKYSKTCSESWNVQEPIKGFMKLMADNKLTLAQIEANLNKLSTWDFSNLGKYRALKAK